MSDHTSSPLLGDTEAQHSPSQRPASHRSHTSERSKNSERSRRSGYSKHSELSERPLHVAESTPLLSEEGNHAEYEGGPTRETRAASAAASSLRSLGHSDSAKERLGRRWPRIVALAILCLIILVILGLGFAAPAVVEEYAKDAMVFRPTDLSIDSFTPSGVRARIQGDFTLDASRVHKKPVRDLGRFGTWLAKAVESKPSEAKVYLPEYGNVLLGTAEVPAIVVDIRNGHTTHVNFLSDLVAGDVDGIRRIANEWLEGRLGQLRVQGTAEIGLKSGLFNFGTQSFSKSLVFKGNDLPTIPQYNITKLDFREVQLKQGQKGMVADVSLTLTNQYPITLTIPPLLFNILVQGCSTEQPYILLADAETEEIDVSPKRNINVNVGGIIRELPESLITACPESEKSPLDLLLGDYIHGTETTVYVRGSQTPSPNTPEWITDLLKSIVIPLPFPGHTFDSLIRDFSLANVHFSLPDPFAAPESPKSQPRLSAVVKALVNLPQEMNFPVQVDRVRANAEVFYHKKKLGLLDLNQWQEANSTRLEADGGTPAGLAVESVVKKAPLKITDDDVFADLLQDMVFGGKGIVLGVKARVDVETESALGKFTVRDLPAEGKVFVKPFSGGHLPNINPHVESLQILETTKSSLTLEAKINITNPTEYSATVPYVNIYILNNETILGHATARNVSVVPGPNHNIRITSVWDPHTLSGKKGARIGRELLSQYISSFNTTLTLQTHAGSIPHQPGLGAALSALSIQIPTPRLHVPKNPNHDPHYDDPDNDPNPSAPHFIDDATMHLLSSTCTLTILSPLPSPLTITFLNATALYNNTLVGTIRTILPFDIPPGASTSPHLPVDWSLDGVGYGVVKKALGGGLKVDARAEIGIGLGRWEDRVWFLGRGVGARVRWF